MRGDRVLAEPAAARLAEEIGELWGVEPQRLAHAGELAGVLADLRTFSLFSTGKLLLAVETGVVADRGGAGALLDAARAALPFTGGADELVGKARDGARRLLQVLRLHDIDPGRGAAGALLGALPDALLGKGRAAADAARRELEPLLAAGLEAGLRGTGEEEASLVADALREGLPERHLLILVESAVSSAHPLVEALERRGAVIDAGGLESHKGGAITGIERLADELERETGVSLGAGAAADLARRTLRSADPRSGEGGIDADSSARFAAEYRKLAALSGGAPIARSLVAANVEDRGEEDVWPILDAIGEGHGGAAWAKVARRLAGAEDPVRERLALFGLVAGYARQLLAVGGAVGATGAPPDERSYARFKQRIAPRLQGELDGVAVNPISKLHPFRLHRAYLAASRFAARELAAIPAKVLATERRLKGDSDDPDAALAELVIELAMPRAPSSAPGPRGGSRRRGASGGRS